MSGPRVKRLEKSFVHLRAIDSIQILASVTYVWSMFLSISISAGMKEACRDKVIKKMTEVHFISVTGLKTNKNCIKNKPL